MAKIYYDSDANLEILKDKRIAIIGFGAQGHAHAQNLHDSGLKVVVGLREESKTAEKVKEAGIEVLSIAEATKASDLIAILIPDEAQRGVYYETILPNLQPGKALLFAHGFNIHFTQIIPPPFVDVIMVAPKGPGRLVREMFKKGIGVPALVAVEQDYTKQALQVALAYAKGLGATKAGVIETTFKEETETDLFGEQCVLCGGTTELIRAGFDTLVEAGYQPEIAYFECLHELKLIVDLIYERGITGMREAISNTAEYGDLTRGRVIINQDTRQRMKKILADIQSGSFAKEWILENHAGRPIFNALAKKDKEHLIEQIGPKLRSMFSWLSK